MSKTAFIIFLFLNNLYSYFFPKIRIKKNGLFSYFYAKRKLLIKTEMKYQLIILLLIFYSCSTEPKTEKVEKTDDWIYLFDEISMEGWRAYNGKELPPQWIIKDGTLTFDTEIK